MPYTDHCDAMVKLNESAFNTIIRYTMLQKPSWFNYATKKLILSNNFCVPVAVDPLLAGTVEKATEVAPLPVFGAPEGTGGMDFCFQVTNLKIDFNPGNTIVLPPELNMLASQEIALRGTIQAGIACGNVLHRADLDRLNKVKVHDRRGLQFHDWFIKKLQSFCLSFYAKAVILREDEFLKLKITGIEIQDLAPVGLENSIECYIRQVLDLAILPKMKIALSKLIFNAKNYFTVGFRNTDTYVPYNPDVSGNEITVFTYLN